MPVFPIAHGTALQGGMLQGGDVSELHAKLYAYAPFLDARQVAVCQTSHIVHAQYLEDVRNSNAHFHIWLCAKITLFVVFVWELEEFAGVQRIGAVLLAQVSEHSAE